MSPEERKSIAYLLHALEDMLDNARLIGSLEANRRYGCYTAEDARHVRAFNEAIYKRKAELKQLITNEEIKYGTR